MKKSSFRVFKFITPSKGEEKCESIGDPLKKLYIVKFSPHKASYATEVPISKFELSSELACIACTKEWAVVRFPQDSNPLLQDVASKLAKRILSHHSSRKVNIDRNIEICYAKTETERFWSVFPADEGTSNLMHK